MQDRGFNSLASNMTKLSVNETKWSSLLARIRALILHISIWIFDFGPEKLTGLSRNGPLQDCSWVDLPSKEWHLWTANGQKTWQHSSICLFQGDEWFHTKGRPQEHILNTKTLKQKVSHLWLTFCQSFPIWLIQPIVLPVYIVTMFWAALNSHSLEYCQ